MATVQIDSNRSDAEESLSTGNVERYHNGLVLGQDSLVGLRFSKMPIPKGATIHSAVVQFTASATDSAPIDLVIKGELIDDAPKFGHEDYDLSARQQTVSSTSWTTSGWTNGSSGVEERSPELAPILQEIINLEDWAFENDMVLLFDGSGSSSTHRAFAHDLSSSSAAQLTVVFTAPITATMGSDNDDSEENLDDGNVSRGSYNLDLGFKDADPEKPNRVGLRFRDLVIPQGVKITEAYIQFTARHSDSGAASFTIRCETASDADFFTSSDFDLTERNQSQDGPTPFISEETGELTRQILGEIPWSPPAWTSGQRGYAQRTPNLAHLFEQLANVRWEDGNSIAFFIDPADPSDPNGNDKRVAYARDRDRDEAATLIIHTTDGPPPTSPQDLSTSNNTANSVQVNWQSSTDNFGVSKYCIYFNGECLADDISANETSVIVDDLPNTTKGSFAMTAVDFEGNESPLSQSLSVGKSSAGIDKRIFAPQVKDNASFVSISFEDEGLPASEYRTWTILDYPQCEDFTTTPSVVTSPIIRLYGKMDGPLEDPDNDGLENIIEYFYGHDPNSGTQEVGIGIDTQSVPGTIIVTFPGRTGAGSEVEYLLQGSDDLQNWDTVPPGSATYENHAGTSDPEIFDCEIHYPTTSKFFYRLSPELVEDEDYQTWVETNLINLPIVLKDKFDTSIDSPPFVTAGTVDSLEVNQSGFYALQYEGFNDAGIRTEDQVAFIVKDWAENQFSWPGLASEDNIPEWYAGSNQNSLWTSSYNPDPGTGNAHPGLNGKFEMPTSITNQITATSANFVSLIENAAGGTEILLPSTPPNSPLTVTAPINVPPGVTITGSSDVEGTTIQRDYPAQCAFFLSDHDNIRIRNLTIDVAFDATVDFDLNSQGNMVLRKLDGICIGEDAENILDPNLTYAERIWIDNLTVKNYTGRGIDIRNTINAWVSKSTFIDAIAIGAGAFVGGNGNGILIGEDSYNCRMSDITVDDCRHGILIQGFDGTSGVKRGAHHNLVERCTVINSEKDSFDLHGEGEYANEIRYCISDSGQSAGIGIGETHSSVAGDPDTTLANYGGHANAGWGNWVHHCHLKDGLDFKGGILCHQGSHFQLLENNVFTGNANIAIWIKQSGDDLYFRGDSDNTNTTATNWWRFGSDFTVMKENSGSGFIESRVHQLKDENGLFLDNPIICRHSASKIIGIIVDANNTMEFDYRVRFRDDCSAGTTEQTIID